MPAVLDRELEQIVAKDGVEKYLERLIAQKKHVKPEDVTEEFIRKQRSETEKKVDVRYDVDSQYGGYCTIGLNVLTTAEINAAIDSLENARKTYL